MNYSYASIKYKSGNVNIVALIINVLDFKINLKLIYAR